MAVPAALHVGFGIPSGPEVLVILGLGVLLFGRRLPEVGRQIGRAVSEFRRGLDSFKREIAQDESFRDARKGLRDLRDTAEAPRRLADPKRLFDDLTDEGRASAAPRASQPGAPPSSQPGAPLSSQPGAPRSAEPAADVPPETS